MMIFATLVKVSRKWAIFISEQDGSKIALTRETWRAMGRPEMIGTGSQDPNATPPVMR